MRKTLCILCLIAVTLFATANDAFAQRRGGGGGRGGGYGGRGGYGYGGYRYGGYGIGAGLYIGGSPYYYGGGYYSSPTYGYSTPAYYPDTVTQAPPTNVRQSFYAEPNAATVNVFVPSADAQVWFDDSPTSQRGMERVFQTGALQQSGTYTIKARWVDNGRSVDQQRKVQVQPGQSVTVNFRTNPSEPLSLPKN